MTNLFKDQGKPDLIFDLKGSTKNRRSNRKDSVKKDLDLGKYGH